MKKKLDIEFYSNAKSDFIANLRRRNVKTWTELNNELSLYCACFGLPVFVAITFVKEAYPEFTKELEEKEQIVREFYNYE